MKERGFYIVSDVFFSDYPDPYLKGNKSEKRPHYYALKDNRTGLFWVIPMSSRVEKYRKLITRRESSGRSCDILHIAKLDNGKENVFLIQDMFPISEKYIVREYTIGVNHLTVTDDRLAETIRKKSSKILNMLRHGVAFTPTQPDVLAIEADLLK